MAELYADLPAQAPGARRAGVYYDRRTAGSLQEWLAKVAASPVVYVGNLNFSTTEDELHELFSQAGLVRRVVMGLNKHSREPCGFAFVQFFHPYEAQNSIILLNGASCDGRVVRVDADSGESIENDRKFGRGFTGRQWRDEYREEYDAGRGGEGRKKRSRSEAEEAAFAAAHEQPFFAAGAPGPHVFAPPVAAPGPFCVVPPPPPPAAAGASAVAAAAALDAAVAEEAAAYMWQRNIRARKQHNNTATAAGGGVPARAASGPSPPYTVFSPPPQHAAPYAPASSAYRHGSYLELVQHAQQQPAPGDPFGGTGSGAASFMRSRGGRNAGRHQRGGGGRT